MTLQDLANLAEVVGAITTAAALIYLAIQIRANTISVRIESRRASFANTSSALIAIAEDGELARVFNAGLADLSSLNSTDATRFTMLFAVFVSQLSVTFDETRLGVAHDRHSFRTVLHLLRTPGGRQWWGAYRSRYGQEFQKYIDSELLQSKQPSAAERGRRPPGERE